MKKYATDATDATHETDVVNPIKVVHRKGGKRNSSTEKAVTVDPAIVDTGNKKFAKELLNFFY